MDIYIIPPNAHLELMNQGDRFFCLAQQYKKDQKYREFFKQKVKDGAWVTLDNGAGDHDIVTPEQLKEVMWDLDPSEVIPPDFLFDGIKTIQAFHNFRSCVLDHNAMKGFDLITGEDSTTRNTQIFICPQGRDQNEWLFVYEYFLTHPDVSTIGFSKIAVPKAFMGVTGDKMIKEARNYAWDFLKAKDLIKKPIHFLGMGDPREMLHYKGEEFARSTDSCNTIWSAMNHQSWDDGTFERIPTPKDYFDRTLGYFSTRIAQYNISYFKELVK